MSDDPAVRMDDLLAHRQWVRSLARRLAADESRADDLEQETWLAAVENPPRDPRSVRGWLGTVLRNVHRNSLRGDTRRERRETASPPREPEPEAPELVAEAETQHVLVREVLDLDEPYRSTVLLRWFEDLTPTQIAARQGVPLDTVKTRLKRAVERLRARMDARHGGDRRAWCVLLLGRGDGVGTGTGVTAGTKAALTTAAGGVAMGLATKLTIAAAVLVAASAFWWFQGDGAVPPAAPAAETADAKPAAPAKREHRAAPADDSTSTRAVDLSKVDRDRDLHGVVLGPDGSPVVGATIQAVDYPWRRTMTMNVAAWFDGKMGASTTSGDGGAFALRLRRGQATVVRLTARGLATVELGPYQAGERVEIQMTAAVTLRVSLRSESQAPVAGAQLWLLGFGDKENQPWVSARGTTDAGGKCDFDGLPGGAQLLVAPLSGVGDFGNQRVALPVSGETSLAIVAPAGRTIRGRVFDAVTLSPVTGAKVGLGKGVFCATTTDGGGRFEIRGFTGKGESNVEVLAAGYSIAVLPVGASDAIEFPLRRGFSAAGRVVGPDGRPVAGANVAVEASARGPEQFSCGYATTDADGRFIVADLARAMPHVVSVWTPGCGRARQAVPMPRGDAASVDVGDVKLSAARAIEGRVLKPNGSPSPGVDVRLTGPNAESDAGFPGPGSQESRRTDDLGRFRFGDLAPGEYSVEMGPRSSSAPTMKVTLPADRDVLDVVLPPKPTGGEIVVVVKDDAGAPVAGLNVIGSGEMRGSVVAHTDAAGRAVLAPPQQGRVSRIDVGEQMPTQPFLRVPTILVEPNRREYAVTIERGAFVSCRLLDPDGAPVAKASVTVEPGERSMNFLLTGADGRVRLALPRQGEFALVFNGGVYGDKGLPVDSLSEARADGVTAQSGEVVLQAHRVPTGRSVTVRLLAADDTPVADNEIRLYSFAGVERKVKTGADGRAKFADLPAHEFYVNGQFLPDRLMLPTTTLVPSGQEVVLKMPAAVTIAGSVVWPSGKPGAGASVSVVGDEFMVFTTNADRDGRFTVQMPAGDSRAFRIDAFSVDGATRGTASRVLKPDEREIRVELK